MINNNFAQPIDLIKDIFNTQYFAVLTSDERGQPYSNLIAFAGTDDLKSLVFSQAGTRVNIKTSLPIAKYLFS
jgi:hypothetical protein